MQAEIEKLITKTQASRSHVSQKKKKKKKKSLKITEKEIIFVLDLGFRHGIYLLLKES